MELRPPVRPTILVVDDDPGLRDSLHLILDDEYEVVDAVDGSEALAALGARRIDLVLLDLVMSRADGFEVLERRGKAEKTVPIVVLSALNTAWTAATAMRLGAVDYVTKPFAEEVLLSVVREALASRSKPRRVPRLGSRVVLVGVDLGIHASLTVLLRSRCRVEHLPNIDEALGHASVLPPDVLIVSWDSLGSQAIETVGWMRRLSPGPLLVVIGRGSLPDEPSLGPCVPLIAPARVSFLLKEIRAHLNAAVAELPIYSPHVSAAIDYLGDHYAVASVRRLGRAVGAAPHHLSALLREEIGISPRAYINQLRVEAAKWLLLETGEKLETVAARIGLYDASHLSRLFLKHAGNRPGAYRRQQGHGRDGASTPQEAVHAVRWESH
jgi:YesN/AraC family two-component response regulator